MNPGLQAGDAEQPKKKKGFSPREFTFVPSLPKSGGGKIRRVV
jgi:acyl-coenzyme A synthetase/AMP-(fatty) acid ligase